MPPTLGKSTDDRVRRDIAKTFFHSALKSSQSLSWQRYFEYYERELGRLSIGLSSLHDASSDLAVKSHDDILFVCGILKSEQGASKKKLKEMMMRLRFTDADSVGIDRSIDLTVRLWLMLNVRDEGMTVRMLQNPPIRWDDQQSLREVIDLALPTSTFHLDSTQRRLSPSFTAANMVKLCSLELRWTDSLEDHLRLDRRRKILWIFPYKEFLVHHVEAGLMEMRAVRHSVLPIAFLQETITTLNLLFPHWDELTQALLLKHDQIFHTTAPFTGPGRLDLGEFKYWRDQLFELYEEIYLAPAQTWRQLWLDRRNPHQYYTFWIALVVFFLSVVSCIASVIQAWASVKALSLQMSS